MEYGMTYKQAVLILSDAGIAEPEINARLLFMRFAGMSRADLLLYGDKDVPSRDLEIAVHRRALRMPIQYIMGAWEFFGLMFSLNADTLIPRPDTETLVEQAIKRLPDGARFCDIGTGSGAIAISVLHNRPDTTAVAVDINENALDAATSNAKLNEVQDRFIPRIDDAFSPDLLSGERFDAIISNPPYIEKSVYEALEAEIFHEPKIALVADDGGLAFYKTLIPKYKSKINPGGFMAFEIGYDQSKALIEIAKENGLCAEIIKDYGGNDRVAFIRV